MFLYSNVKIIDGYAFTASGLIEIDLSETQITSMSDYIFNDCSNLTTVSLPDTLESIGERSFRYCSSLQIIEIPSNVKFIDGYAFAASGLIEIDLSETQITSLSDGIFNECYNLTTVSLPDTLESIGERAFRYCSSLQTIEIPSSVTVIEEYAFYRCTSLTSITIPENVASIGSMAFSNCSQLAEVIIESASIYESIEELTSCGYLINYATMIKVLKSVVDEAGENEFLSNNYTKSEEAVNGYYTFIKVNE